MENTTKVTDGPEIVDEATDQEEVETPREGENPAENAPSKKEEGDQGSDEE